MYQYKKINNQLSIIIKKDKQQMDEILKKKIITIR
jgi:hypothetical protein